MHPRKPLLAALLLALAMLIAPHLATAQAAGDSLAVRVDALFAPWDKPDTPGAAVAVVRDGAIVYERGYGSANLEYGLPITPTTVFLVASVSKQFTAFALAMLADQGMLSLDDDIRNYVPELPDYGPTITIRHLIHHTSGLRDEFGLLAMAGYHMDDVITKETILDLAYRQRALNFDPGEEYLYCNTGYTLMAEIVKRVTGQSFREWTSEHLFEPLGMTHSHFRDDYQSIIKNRAQGYYKEGKAYKKQVVNYASVGASGLYTTAEDLARWAMNFDDGRVGGPAVLEQVHQRGRLNKGDTLSYAFGQSVGQHKGHRWVSHGGSHRGFKTHLVRFPDDGLAVIVLGNVEEFNPSEMAYNVADLYLVDPPERLADFTGAYYSEELDATYHLAVEKGRLTARHRRYDPIHLTPSDTDAFSGDSWFLQTLTFARTDNRITGFRVSNGRVRNVWFERQ